MAEGVAELLGEIDRLQQTLWQREAELATGVPLVADSSDRRNLAPRLQAVLRAGVESVGADAAGLYLLDEATTCLKLRSVWGLPIQKLAHPPRPLRGALADLEALLGHAVVLNDLRRMPCWESPEKGFGSAVCVPVSTETTLLGTLWFFSKEPRDFTSQQTNILEVIAGRIAVELEREVLLADAMALKPWKRHMYDLQQWHEEQAGWNAPCLEGWEIGLWKESGESGWGEFFLHFPWAEGVGLTLGRVEERGLRAVLEAVRVRSTLQSLAAHFRQPHRLLQQTHQVLRTCSGGHGPISVWVSRLVRAKNVPSGDAELIYAPAGPIRLVLVTPQGWKSLSETTPPLGEYRRFSSESNRLLTEHQPAPNQKMPIYKSRRRRLHRGEVLVVFPAIPTEAKRSLEPNGKRHVVLNEIEARLAEHLRRYLDGPAPRLAELVQNFLQKIGQDMGQIPQSLYVLKAR